MSVLRSVVRLHVKEVGEVEVEVGAEDGEGGLLGEKSWHIVSRALESECERQIEKAAALIL